MHQSLLTLPEQLLTERLILRPYKAEDKQAYFELCQRNKQHLIPFEAENPALGVQTVEDAEMLIRQFIFAWSTQQAFFFGAWSHTAQALIAQIYVGPVDWENAEFEIGYFVDSQHQGQGFITEAVRAVIDFCFMQLHARHLCISCNETNSRSWKVAERCGFTRERYIAHRHSDILCADGTPSGDYIYGLTYTDYIQQKFYSPR